MTDLTQREKDILRFENSWYRYAGIKEQHIREKFDLTSTAYFQILNKLIDNPAAMRHDPIIVKSLQAMREKRRRSRSIRQMPGVSA